MNSDDNNIKFSKQMDITVSSGDAELCMAIRRYDWNRIYDRLFQLKDSNSKLPIIYSISFGFAISTGVTIIPINSSAGLPNWVTPLYVCFSIFSLIFGFVLIYIDRNNKNESKSNIKEILKDMKSLEALYKDS